MPLPRPDSKPPISLQITLNTSTAGSYDVYYNVYSNCGNGTCPILSNQALVTATVVTAPPTTSTTTSTTTEPTTTTTTSTTTSTTTQPPTTSTTTSTTTQPPTNVLVDVYNNVDGTCVDALSQIVVIPGGTAIFGKYYNSDTPNVIYYPVNMTYSSGSVFFNFSSPSDTCPPPA